ncbi:MAG TPA: hypothetical protein VMH36_26235 [Alphaproteobacteria bacterium]|nr:hypothetical protein [Alphaproteobacteria bacterium]
MTLLVAVAGCGPDYSPNTYSTAAVQQANKVDQGVIAGFREIRIRADGTVGAVTGGAAGGVLGAQEPDGGVITALSAIGGTLVGGLIGTSVEHAADDTTAFEYIVRKTGGELIAVAQKDVTPLPVGLKVLVIEGKQARIVADYIAPLEVPGPSAAKNDKLDGSRSEKTTNVAPSPVPSDAASAPVQASPPPPDQPAAAPARADNAPGIQAPASAQAPSSPAAQQPEAAPPAVAAPAPAPDDPKAMP